MRDKTPRVDGLCKLTRERGLEDAARARPRNSPPLRASATGDEPAQASDAAASRSAAIRSGEGAPRNAASLHDAPARVPTPSAEHARRERPRSCGASNLPWHGAQLGRSEFSLQGGQAVSRRIHAPEIAGSTPAPATATARTAGDMASPGAFEPRARRSMASTCAGSDLSDRSGDAASPAVVGERDHASRPNVVPMRGRARGVVVQPRPVSQEDSLPKQIARLRWARKCAKHTIDRLLADLASAQRAVADAERQIGPLVAAARRAGERVGYMNDDLQLLIGDDDENDEGVAS